MSKSNYYTTTELAELLGVSRVTVFNMIKDGRIEAEKVGRNYIIPADSLGIYGEPTADRKKEISKAVKKTIKEYGETLKLLADE